MDLWENCRTKLKKGGFNSSYEGQKPVCIVRRMGSMGRKRVEPMCLSSPCKTPLKKPNVMRSDSEKSQLEGLPQDILIRILCGVEHDDLEKLLCVSRAIRDATVIAKEWHFAYHTPTAKTTNLGPFNDVGGDDNDLNSQEAPNAPKPRRSYKSRIRGKKIGDITVALFSSDEE